MSPTTITTIVATVTYEYPHQFSEPSFTTTVTWENLGPLTTTFTAPASCTTIPLGNLVAFNDNNPADPINFSENCNDINNASSPAFPSWIDCQPYPEKVLSILTAATSFKPHADKAHPFNFYQSFISPGLYCPSGYSTANAFALSPPGVTTTSLNAYELRTTGTHVQCCPSGYFISLYSCISKVTTSTSTSLCNFLCDEHPDTCGQLTPFSWKPEQQATTVEHWLDPIYMIHQQSDVPKKGLSTADKIAIGVIVPVVLLAIVFGGLFFMRKLRKKNRPVSNVRSLDEYEMQQGMKKDQSVSDTKPVETTGH